MYEKNDKRRVYWLIDLYLAGKIDDKTFCDEFYYSYDLEMDGSTLTKLEREVFDVLSIVTERCSFVEEEDPEIKKVFPENLFKHCFASPEAVKFVSKEIINDIKTSIAFESKAFSYNLKKGLGYPIKNLPS